MNKKDIKMFILEILDEHNNFPITQFSNISLFKGDFNIIDLEKNSFLLTGVSKEFSEALFELQEEDLISAIEVDDVDYLFLNEDLFEPEVKDEGVLLA